MTWNIIDTSKLNWMKAGDIRVEVVAMIRDNLTMIVKEHPTECTIYAGETVPSPSWWSEGNACCDCNRKLFFTEDDLSEEETPCGDGGYSVNLVNPVDDNVFYREFE